MRRVHSVKTSSFADSKSCLLSQGTNTVGRACHTPAGRVSCGGVRAADVVLVFTLCLLTCLHAWTVGWLDGWLVGRLVGWTVVWLDGWLVGRLIGWTVGWLDGWLVALGPLL